MSENQLWAMLIFMGFAIGLGAWSVLTSIADVRDAAEETDELFSQSPVFKAILPFVQHFGRVVAPLRFLNGFRSDLQLKLTRAGKIFAITPDEYIGLMIVSGIGGMIVGAYFVAMVDMDWDLVPTFGLLISFLPYLSLRESITKRQKAIRKVLPYTLDLLTLAVEAGLDFGAALNRIGEKLGTNPFRDEVRLLTRDLTVGKTRGEALRDLDHRIGLEELRSVTSALIQADELGASLGPTLRIQSRELQRKRFQRAEKKAMQAPVLMLIPLVLFIFPLVFMVIFSPLVLKVLTMDFNF